MSNIVVDVKWEIVGKNVVIDVKYMGSMESAKGCQVDVDSSSSLNV